MLDHVFNRWWLPVRFLFTAVFSFSESSAPPSTSSQRLCLSSLMSLPLNIQCLHLGHRFPCIFCRKKVKGEPHIYSSFDMLPDFVNLCLVLLKLLELEKTLVLKSLKFPHFTHGQTKFRAVGCLGITTVQWPQSSEVGQTWVWIQPPPVTSGLSLDKLLNLSELPSITPLWIDKVMERTICM